VTFWAPYYRDAVAGGISWWYLRGSRTLHFFRFDGHFSSAPQYPVGSANDFKDLCDAAFRRRPIVLNFCLKPVV
jgi:hypothetical protein